MFYILYILVNTIVGEFEKIVKAPGSPHESLRKNRLAGSQGQEI